MRIFSTTQTHVHARVHHIRQYTCAYSVSSDGALTRFFEIFIKFRFPERRYTFWKRSGGARENNTNTKKFEISRKINDAKASW